MLGVLIFPLIIKKKIQELKIAGILLFSGVILFIVLMFLMKLINSSDLPDIAGETKEFYKLQFDKPFFSSLSTALVAYGFQSAFFPIYNSLEKKTYANGMKFTILGIGFCFIIYMLVMFISLYSFGIHVEGDVLVNVEGVSVWESYVLRGIFLLVISTHTPFIFFIGKESILALLALIYTRNEPDVLEEYTNLDETHEPLVTERKHNSQHVRSFKHLNRSKQIICSSVDYNISLAIPFGNKRLKTIEMSKADGTPEPQAAHDILPNSWYYIVTLLLYAGVLTASCLIEDVEIVIKFIGSLANSMLNFTLPGVFYYIIMTKYEVIVKQRWKLYFALALALYGLVMGIGCTGINVWTTISPLEEEGGGE